MTETFDFDAFIAETMDMDALELAIVREEREDWKSGRIAGWTRFMCRDQIALDEEMVSAGHLSPGSRPRSACFMVKPTPAEPNQLPPLILLPPLIFLRTGERPNFRAAAD